ncbi:hypothetical protein [uncultured Clostridium sp.]|jgi:hypothetical protein|uniref:hypothetical protein n=1 Tax=uncultured Clostridium sp. TaxID=59620 RepID=UPI002611993B|nr:hypothetical protein [uncultured Clostridium sp.]
MKDLAKRELRHLFAKYEEEIGKKTNEEIIGEIAIEMAKEGANIPPMDELKIEIYEALIVYKTEHNLY